MSASRAMDDADRTRPYRRPVDPARLITTDPDAEATLAGCAIARHDAAARISARLDPDDLHDPTHRHIITAAAALDPTLTDTDTTWRTALDETAGIAALAHGCHRRIHALADTTSIAADRLLELVATRAVAADTTDWYLKRVKDATETRRRTRRWIEQGARLGVDVDGLHRIDPAAAVLDLAARAAAALAHPTGPGVAAALSALHAIAVTCGTDPTTAETVLADAYHHRGNP